MQASGNKLYNVLPCAWWQGAVSVLQNAVFVSTVFVFRLGGNAPYNAHRPKLL